MKAASRRPAEGGRWQLSLWLCMTLLAACASGEPMRATAPLVSAAPAAPDPITPPEMDIPAQALAGADTLVDTMPASPGQAVDRAIATGEEAADQAARQGVTAVQQAASRAVPAQVDLTGLETGTPALQGGTLSGPLGSVEVRRGASGAQAAASLEPAAGIGVVIQAEPDALAAGLDLGSAVQVDAASDADSRRLAAALQIARGLSVGAASEGDMKRGAIAWRIAQRSRLSATVGSDGSRGAGVRALDRFGFSVDQSQNETRRRISVDVAPGFTVETSGPLDSSEQAPDDRIGLKWMLRY